MCVCACGVVILCVFAGDQSLIKHALRIVCTKTSTVFYSYTSCE